MLTRGLYKLIAENRFNSGCCNIEEGECSFPKRGVAFPGYGDYREMRLQLKENIESTRTESNSCYFS
jgi:hypothetical protein